MKPKVLIWLYLHRSEHLELDIKKESHILKCKKKEYADQKQLKLIEPLRQSMLSARVS